MNFLSPSKEQLSTLQFNVRKENVVDALPFFFPESNKPDNDTGSNNANNHVTNNTVLTNNGNLLNGDETCLGCRGDCADPACIYKIAKVGMLSSDNNNSTRDCNLNKVNIQRQPVHFLTGYTVT